MRSIKRSFEKYAEKNSSLGAYPCLAKISMGKKYSRKSLVKAFKEVMPKSEYAQSEAKRLIDHLSNLTNMLEEVELRTKNDHSHAENGRKVVVLV